MERRRVSREWTCVMLFAAAAFALASTPDTWADITSVQAEITAINGQIASLTSGQITPLEADIAKQKAGMTEARTFMNEFTKRNDWLVTEYGVHKRRLKEYEGRALQLNMSYEDFFTAERVWKETKDPETARTQILIMFRFLYGYSQEPSQFELDPSTQDDFVVMADWTVRGKAVARMGEALVLLGDLTLQLVEAITSVPQSMKEAAFQVIKFTVDTTVKLLPDDVVNSLNNTCLQYIPYLELQKERAELLASQLNEIRNREEFGGENGRVEALAKTRALIEFEQSVIAKLEPELNAYLAQKATVEANFATLQGEINDKQQQLDTLKQQLRLLNQNKIDKEFELVQLQEQEAIAQNGGPTNYVTGLSISATNSTIAIDALSSALLNLPRYALLAASANYVSEKSAQCSYSDGGVTRYESYHTKQIFSAAVTNPEWRKISPTGDVNIVGNRAYAVTAGNVPLQTALSPAFTGESYGASQNCSQDYLPEGSGEKLSATVNINVKKVDDALFLPYFYYAEALRQGLSGTAAFEAMKTAAETYGKGIDLFASGTVQQWGSVVLYYTVLNADGTLSFSYTTPQMKPEGDLPAFEIDNQMKVLGNGTATVWPLLFDKDGLQVPAGTVNGLTVTGNKVEAKVSANGVEGLTSGDAVTAVINEPAQFAVAVKGPADMTRYQVNWRYFILQTTGYPTGYLAFTRHNGAAVTGFSGASGSWLSANPATLTEPSDYNRAFKVEFDIVRKYDGAVVYTGKFDRIHSVVKGLRFFLANRTTGVPYSGNNYFLFRGLNFTAPSITSLSMELRLDIGDDKSVVVPLTDFTKGIFYGTNAAANQDLGFINLYDKYLYMSLSSLDDCGRVNLGIFELKEADMDSLFSNLGIVVARTQNTSMSLTDVNLLRVYYRETQTGPYYLLKVCGPTPLTYFKVKWTFFDDTTAESPLNTFGVQRESMTPMVRSLKKVELVNGQGATAAQASFLSASAYNDRVRKEIGMYYTIVSEYRFDAALNRYAGQLKRLVKNDLDRAYTQMDLDFSFPDASPQVRVKTVNDLNNQLIPLIENFSATAQAVSFDVTKPGELYTALTVLKNPASGALVIDGNHAAYTPHSGFKGTDRFLVRIAGPVCDIEPDVMYFNLEGEVDMTGELPVVRFRQIFTPVYQYGAYPLGFVLMDENKETLALSVTQAPAQMIVDIAENVVGVKTGTLPGNGRDQFKLSLAAGEATVNAWYYTAYPEFFVYKNQDYRIPKMFILHRFFEFFGSDVQKVKIDYWFNGTMLINGQPHSYSSEVSLADLDTLTFRPETDFTGPTSFGLRASDGVTWALQQIRIGGRIIEGGGQVMENLIRVLQLLSGREVYLSDLSTVMDINGDGQIGLPEAIYILQTAAGIR